MKPWRIAGLCLALLLADRAEGGPRRPLTLSPVGAPIAGSAPGGLAVAGARGGTFVFVGDRADPAVRSLRLDPRTGTLFPVGAVPLPDEPLAMATLPGGRYVLATSIGNDVTSLSFDAATGLLDPVGTVASGGENPVSIDVSPRGVAVVANRATNNVGVFGIDRRSGSIDFVSSVTVGTGPRDVKLTGRHAIVGHEGSNDLHVLRFDRRQGTYLSVSVVPVGAPVTGLDAEGRNVVAGTADGRLHYYRLRSDQLVGRGSFDTGGDLADLTVVKDGPLDWTVFTAGLNRLAAFRLGGDDLASLATVALDDPTTLGPLTAVVGRQKTTYVVANDVEGNLTQVFAARRARGGPTSSSTTTTLGGGSTTTTTLAPGGVTPVPIIDPEGVVLLGAQFFGGIGAQRLALLVAGANGWAIVDGVTGEVLEATYVGPGLVYVAQPLGAFAALNVTANAAAVTGGIPGLQAVVQAGPSPLSPAVTGYDLTAGFGFTQISPGRPTCFDAVPYGGDALSGGAVVACGRKLETLEPDESVTAFTGGTTYDGFAPTGPVVSSAFRQRAGGPIVAVTDGAPGTIWKHPATSTPGETPLQIGPAGNGPRRLRCAPNGVCAVSNFDSDALTVLTWDAQDAVSIVGTVAVGDGPVGIDVRPRGDGNVEVVSTGFNDASYSITVLGPDGATVSNQKRPAPAGCAAPGHGIWVGPSQVVLSCNGSDAVAVVSVP